MFITTPVAVCLYYTVSQKSSHLHFKHSVTLSNLNRFSKFLHCRKAHEICYNKLK